ncbi:MAG: HD domain-containing protein [Butyrivibrio sp.]|nr:HD domain-containing protein [Butyrivibrio sp.]
MKPEPNFENFNIILETICNIIEFRGVESRFHQNRIQGFTNYLACTIMEYYPEYGLTPDRIELLTYATVFHDIGKIAIPDSILLKAGRLTDREFDVMKSHTTHGCTILEQIRPFTGEEFFSCAYDICRHHHERYDGRGYPDCLSGEDISIEAQIASLADVYDALVSDRVYKAAYSTDKAFDMIINGECGTFSEKILTCFKECRHEMEELADGTKAIEISERGGYHSY